MGAIELRQGQVLVGPLFSEPMRVETVTANGTDSWSVGLVGRSLSNAWNALKSSLFWKTIYQLIIPVPDEERDLRVIPCRWRSTVHAGLG